MNIEMKTTSSKRQRENTSFLDIDHNDHHHGYECKTCGRRFTTYQALGGHQGIHKKIKLGDDNDACWLTLNFGAPKSSELHRCKLCMRGFGTGQALGGHMRLHRLEKALILMETSWQNLAVEEIVENELIMADVQSLRMKKIEEDEPSNLKRDLILAAKEWRLSI